MSAEMEYFEGMIPRILQNNIVTQLSNPDLPRGVVLYGPRQVGKTTLTQEIIKHFRQKTLVVSGDTESDERRILESRDWGKMKLLLSGYEMLVIDEAQRIGEVGLVAKIVLDASEEIKVILTGSAALDLASKVSEPLTGRAYNYHLWPISQGELATTNTYAERLSTLEERVIYGSYPKVLSLDNQADRQDYLLELVDKYLYKDILDYGGMRNSRKVRDLLKLLAYQIGSQVSIAELATRLEMSRDSVNNYIDLLEASFVIFRLPGFGRNLRNEMKKMNKIYFWDTGIRNALLSQYGWKNERHDYGELWENTMIVERMKRNEYEKWRANYYYWRLSSGAELDLVEEIGGKLLGCEIKSGDKTPKVPPSWTQGYPEAQYEVVNRDNWNDWVVSRKA